MKVEHIRMKSKNLILALQPRKLRKIQGDSSGHPSGHSLSAHLVQTRLLGSLCPNKSVFGLYRCGSCSFSASFIRPHTHMFTLSMGVLISEHCSGRETAC